MAHFSLERIRKLQAEAQTLLAERSSAFGEHGRYARLRHFTLFWIRVFKGFVRNRGPARAAGLAYTTLLALVPVLAVVVSVSTSLLSSEEGKVLINTWIDEGVNRFAPQLGLISTTAAPEDDPWADEYTGGDARREVTEKIANYIANFQSGRLGVTAIVALILVAIGLLISIESAFNDIWGTAKGRGWVARVVQYWAALTLGPLLGLVAVGINTGKHFETAKEWLASIPFFGSIMGDLVLAAVPLIMLVLVCGLFYFVMPNAKVHWQAALIGGLVAGSLLHLNSTLNVLWVSRVTTYKTIYGGLVAVPLFMVGLYFSWMILLFGAQVAYAFQNRRAYAQDRQAQGISQTGREFLALRLMTIVGQRFQGGQKPPSGLEMAEALAVPMRLVTQIMCVLVGSQLVVEANPNDTDGAYVPARPLENITAQEIIQALRSSPGQEFKTAEDKALPAVRREFQAIRDAEKQTAESVSLADLVARAGAA